MLIAGPAFCGKLVRLGARALAIVSMALGVPTAALAAWPQALLEDSGVPWPIVGLTILVITAGLAIGRSIWAQRRLGFLAKQAQAAEELLTDLNKVASDWVWTADAELRIQSVSDGFLKHVGCDPSFLIGHPWHEAPGIEMTDEVKRSVAVALAAQRSFRDLNCRLVASNGDARHFRLIGRPFFDERGNLDAYRGAGVDISDLVEAKERVRYLDRHDVLTGLSNRIGLRDSLERLLRMRRGDAEGPMLIAIDISRFGSINDAFGTSAGDTLLRQFADRLVASLRPDDEVYRLGNDEFMILRSHPSPFETESELVARLQGRLGEPFDIDGQRVRVTSYMGIYHVEAADREVETCTRRAQIALRHGKMVGEQAVTYAAGMDVEAEVSRRLEEDLRISIRNDGLSLSYQPQLSLKRGRIIGAEALVRWHHRDHGFVSPSRFIPLAERTGIISELSRWALRRACEDALGWGDTSISVNLSALDVGDETFPLWVHKIVSETGIQPSRVELEITEGVLIQDTDLALGKLRTLKQMGFKIALDDFGTGYAGLGYLQMFPFDKLKIDQSFIKRMLLSKHAMAIVRTVIKLAHELDLVTCAEGVEEQAQLEALHAAGCDLIQGYYTGMPMGASRLRALTTKRPASPRPATRAAHPRAKVDA